jgi:hypothetical protein
MTKPLLLLLCLLLTSCATAPKLRIIEYKNDGEIIIWKGYYTDNKDVMWYRKEVELE